MTTTATTTVEDLDLDALEADALRRIEDLEEQREKLSLDALSDRDAAAALLDCESMLASARAEVERVKLARTEQGRREAHAREAAEQRLREQAERRVQKLRGEVHKSEVLLDESMAALAERIASHRELLGRYSEQLRASGDRGVRLDTGWLQRPLAYHLAQGGVRDAVELGPVPRPAPLATDLRAERQ